MSKNQFKIKVINGSKRNKKLNAKGIKRQPKLKSKYLQLLFLFLKIFKKLLILIINLILMFYEITYHNSNSLYFMFIYGEL